MSLTFVLLILLAGFHFLFYSFSKKKWSPVKRHGEIVFDKVIPIGLVMDERIADGAQFALACKKLQSILQHPEVLEQPPEVVKEDIK